MDDQELLFGFSLTRVLVYIYHGLTNVPISTVSLIVTQSWVYNTDESVYFGYTLRVRN